MRIGELATAVGVTTRTVRHYHHLGLLPEPERRANGYLDYTLRHAALHAANVVRPHVLDPGSGTLRIRRAVHVDLRIPLERIASVRRELRMSHERADGELDVGVGSQTTVTLELTEPVTHVTFFGRPRGVRIVRFHADEPDALVRALATGRWAPQA